MAVMYDTGIFSVINSDSSIGVGWKLNFYASGTTTRKATYPTEADANARTNPNSNPVVADANGRFSAIWLTDTAYKAVLATDANVVKVTRDPAYTGAPLSGFTTPEQYGAVGDGTTDDYAAFAAADVAAASQGLILLLGRTYRLNTSYSTTARLVWGGGKIKPANATVFTVGAGVEASPVQIFDTSLGGTIAFNTRFIPFGWAEWWGLTPESPGADTANIASINAAITALRETRLLPKSYYTASQITVGDGNKRLIGAASQYDGTNEGRVTRILCTSATAHILYMGASSFTSIAALPRGIYVSDLFLTRSVGPNVTSGATGLFARYSLFSAIDRVKTDNSVYGFQISGTVHLKVTDCHTTRSTAGTGGTDIFYGFYLNGSASIGANGANASAYLRYCNAEGGIAISNSVGFYADQKQTDIFLHYPETSNFNTGIELAGAGANTTLNYDNIDIEILGPKLDTFGFAGLYMHDMNKYGSIEVIGGYYGPKSGATAAVLVSSNLAAARVEGGQFLMGAATTTYGVRIVNSSNVLALDNEINECTATAVIIDGGTNCKVTAFVKNNSLTCGAAVQMFNTCTANVIAPMASGGASKVQYGIQVVGAGDARNEYNVSGIDSGCLPAANRKLDRNGTPVTAIGLTGTNYATGVFT